LENYKVSLSDIVSETGAKAIFLPEVENWNLKKVYITTSEVNRPGLQLAGFFDYFDAKRIQVIGKVEASYLSKCTPSEISQKFSDLFSRGIPALFVAHNIEIYPEILEQAKIFNVPIFVSEDSTSSLMYNLIRALNVSLAPRITMHGVLVDVYGEGILMVGDSGVGKSETAMELLKRGHRLVADDAVDIKRVSNKTLVGSSPPMIAHLIELRGIGVVDVRHIFGMGAVKETENIDLVVQMEPWQEHKQYERFGLDDEYYEILGLQRPSVTIPIKPGRNLAIIIEVAAMNNRQKRLGYNAAVELNKRMLENLSKTGNED